MNVFVPTLSKLYGSFNRTNTFERCFEIVSLISSSFVDDHEIWIGSNWAS